MTVASTRMTFGTILGAIQTSAKTITSTLDAANAGVGMINKFVSDAAENQQVRSKIDNQIFKSTLLKTKAMELAEASLQADAYSLISDQHKLRYEESLRELNEALGNTKSS